MVEGEKARGILAVALAATLAVGCGARTDSVDPSAPTAEELQRAADATGFPVDPPCNGKTRTLTKDDAKGIYLVGLVARQEPILCANVADSQLVSIAFSVVNEFDLCGYALNAEAPGMDPATTPPNTYWPTGSTEPVYEYVVSKLKDILVGVRRDTVKADGEELTDPVARASFARDLVPHAFVSYCPVS
jgi:hypothetical protein